MTVIDINNKALQQSHKGHVIEFFGLSGVGKTTVARAVLQELRKSGSDVAGIEDYLGTRRRPYARHARRLLLCALEAPTIISNFRVLWSFLAVRQERIFDHAKIAYNVCTLMAVMARARRAGKVLLLDEGLIQAIWSALLYARSATNAEPAAELLKNLDNWPTEVVVLSSTTELTRARLEERESKHSRLQSRAEADVWTRAETLHDHLLDHLSVASKRQVRQLHIFEAEGHSVEELTAGVMDALNT
ncbi:MAG: AAA family ATPase [Pseudomonadota bacterium]